MEELFSRLILEENFKQFLQFLSEQDGGSCSSAPPAECGSCQVG